VSKRSKILLGLLAGGFMIWAVLGYIASYFFVVTRPEQIDDRAEIGGHPLIDITLKAEDGLRIAGWYVPNGPKKEKAVILLNGIWGNREGMTSRAELYLARGYAVLLPDLRGTGESEGDMVTYGWQERHDLKAAYAFLRENGYEHVGAHGISLGAATICYSCPEISDYDFVILESSYDNLENAYRNRLAMVGVPEIVALPVRYFVQWRLGEWAENLQPMESVKACNAPTLVMAGDAERELKLSETQALFANVGATDKQLHIFPGGRHENFYSRFKEDFVSAFNTFLDQVEAKWQAENGLQAAA
jgi:alpha-beta hydrolase superfamily lysophospholipase